MSNNQELADQQIAARLLEIRKAFGLSQKKLAQIVEANQSNVSAALSGKRGVPKVWIYKLISRYTKLNEKWIWTGEGEMLNDINTQGASSSDPMLIMDVQALKESNGRQLSKDEMERMLARMAFRIEELEEWKREMENWKNEIIVYLMEEGRRQKGLDRG